MQGCHLQTNNTLFTFTSFSVISFFFLIMFFFFHYCPCKYLSQCSVFPLRETTT